MGKQEAPRDIPVQKQVADEVKGKLVNSPKKINISELSLVELKALAYDQEAVLRQQQQTVTTLKTEIRNRLIAEQQAKAKDVKDNNAAELPGSGDSGAKK
jgi:hypothetical protein